jgi:hypothetical protein
MSWIHYCDRDRDPKLIQRYDPYVVLGQTRTPKAWRNLVRYWNPDKSQSGLSKEENTGVMVHINKAWEDVEIKERKKEQDRELKEERKSAQKQKGEALAQENLSWATCHTRISVGDGYLS